MTPPVWRPHMPAGPRARTRNRLPLSSGNPGTPGTAGQNSGNVGEIVGEVGVPGFAKDRGQTGSKTGDMTLTWSSVALHGLGHDSIEVAHFGLTSAMRGLLLALLLGVPLRFLPARLAAAEVV